MNLHFLLLLHPAFVAIYSFINFEIVSSPSLFLTHYVAEDDLVLFDPPAFISRVLGYLCINVYFSQS